MRERSTYTFVVLTFLGMVGIYIGAYLAWKKYQSYKESAQSSLLGNLLSSL